MSGPSSQPDDLFDSLIVWLFGFIGAALAVVALPKLLKYLSRHVLAPILVELLATVTVGLLTGKLTEQLASDPPDRTVPVTHESRS